MCKLSVHMTSILGNDTQLPPSLGTLERLAQTLNAVLARLVTESHILLYVVTLLFRSLHRYRVDIFLQIVIELEIWKQHRVSLLLSLRDTDILINSARALRTFRRSLIEGFSLVAFLFQRLEYVLKVFASQAHSFACLTDCRRFNSCGW